MAKQILIGCRTEVNGVNLTDHVSHVEVIRSAAEVPTTNMSSTGEERILGIRNDSFVIHFQQDFAAALVDATLNPLFENGTAFSAKIRVGAAAISPTNPEYQGTCVLSAYTPFAGDVGALADSQVTLPANGAIIRAVA